MFLNVRCAGVGPVKCSSFVHSLCEEYSAVYYQTADLLDELSNWKKSRKCIAKLSNTKYSFSHSFLF